MSYAQNLLDELEAEGVRLSKLLAGGPLYAFAVQEEADAAGIADRTLRRAKDALGVEVGKEKGKKHGKSVWTLPKPDDLDSTYLCPKNNVALTQNIAANDSQLGQLVQLGQLASVKNLGQLDGQLDGHGQLAHQLVQNPEQEKVGQVGQVGQVDHKLTKNRENDDLGVGSVDGQDFQKSTPNSVHKNDGDNPVQTPPPTPPKRPDNDTTEREDFTL